MMVLNPRHSRKHKSGLGPEVSALFTSGPSLRCRDAWAVRHARVTAMFGGIKVAAAVALVVAVGSLAGLAPELPARQRPRQTRHCPRPEADRRASTTAP